MEEVVKIRRIIIDWNRIGLYNLPGIIIDCNWLGLSTTLTIFDVPRTGHNFEALDGARDILQIGVSLTSDQNAAVARCEAAPPFRLYA